MSEVAPTPANASARPLTAHPAHLGWRLLAMTYDLLPVLGLCLVAFIAIELPQTVDPKAPLQPDRAAGVLEWLLIWLVCGAYAVVSWRRGGQTIGMRPWRLKVLAGDGRPASIGMLCLRYVIATVSLLLFGLGFWWSLWEPECRAWHDLATGTRFVRMQAS
jgi:uncharacterized RDD family membrane protein YckC